MIFLAFGDLSLNLSLDVEHMNNTKKNTKSDFFNLNLLYVTKFYEYSDKIEDIFLYFMHLPF